MDQKTYKFAFKLTVAVAVLLLLSLISLSYGDSKIGLINSLNALFGVGEKSAITIVQNIRLPRVLAAILAGATLGLSGLYTRTALKNPLADSSILGIQSGASVMALFALLVFPQMADFLPLFAFIGGFIAFCLVILFSYQNGFSPIRLVLSGVAINSFFTAITSVITINHVNELRNTVQWTSGSLVGISNSDVQTMLIYSLVAIGIAALLIPMLELLKLEDNMLISLGKNPNVYRFIASIVAVFLASISLAFVGVIAFVGIIVPHISQMIVGSKMKHIFPMTLVCGAILVVGVDLFSRVMFTNEIPVGALIGVLGAPLFLYLLRGAKNGI
ncbi:iron ABC transporter permease [Mollicutes bacterium LVI A0078]|nr:iron ABC transporter permease [Mollicutes bacterium LVI A0075]WOO91545.1 iron ABC transporter permease [Mollicutes bacterium LVI A0078]